MDERHIWVIKLCFWIGKKDKKLKTTALKDFYLVAVVVILFLYWFLTVKSRETRAAKTQQQVASRGGKNWIGISLKNIGRCVYHSRILKGRNLALLDISWLRFQTKALFHCKKPQFYVANRIVYFWSERITDFSLNGMTNADLCASSLKYRRYVCFRMLTINFRILKSFLI